ncbi:uncharacterized protein LTHEOB_12725 [Lasiodiplodia theobromae]|uniref:uncharacterized protein n=1 Tax=Lasiodiplodia theobromae TaxID=45133 RepID=UPI0015C2D089|nr:uncharacterized protein LTHEOB_12725 [Lasiodiplodia theobromae]KAF4535192.1 hypothetical protein LTHEOB_12725 [Lasiodiplodia theobromae]
MAPNSSRRATAAATATGMLDQYWEPTGLCGLIARTTLRTTQFVLAIIVAGLYGADLAHNTQTSTHAPTNWVYAEVVAALSALTCAYHCFVTVKVVAWCVWDGVVAVLWAAHFGVFASTYLGARPEGEGGEEWDLTTDVRRMKVGMGIGYKLMGGENESEDVEMGPPRGKEA